MVRALSIGLLVGVLALSAGALVGCGGSSAAPAKTGDQDKMGGDKMGGDKDKMGGDKMGDKK